jgi:DNA polymerase elongation subunit (family B)
MANFYTSVERMGNHILWRGYENGRRFSRKIDYEPILFIPTKDTNAQFRTLIGEKPLQPKKFSSMSEAKDFVERYKEVNGFDIHGNTHFVQQFIQEKYPDAIKFDMSQINLLSFDIEVDISTGFADMDKADKEITSVTIKSSKSSTYHLLGRKDYDKTKTITGINPDDIAFEKFDTEKALLRRFVEIWTNNYPDIVTGWNVTYFDIYYIVTRIANLLGDGKAKELSPWGKIRKKTDRIMNRDQSTYEISGVEVIDYMDAFKKFGYKYGTQESYKLDHIAYVVLGLRKLDYTEYGSLTELYNQNPQLYLDYNLRDTQIIQMFEDETALLSLVLTVAYGGGVNYADAFGTVGIWESTLYRKLMSKNIVPPIKSSPGEQTNDLVGGYVKDPVVGKSEWVVSFDLNSLYPHLILQSNMSPETFIPDHRENVSIDRVLSGDYRNTNPDFSVCANGVCFTNKKLGVIPEIIDEYYGNRKIIKKEMLRYEQLEQDESDKGKKREYKTQITQLHNAQMAIKIAMNSLYGAAANRYFLYYLFDMAEAITTSGQLSIRYAEKTVNDYLNRVLKTTDLDYVVCGDTDSIYVNMKPLVESVFGKSEISRDQGEAFLDQVCKTKIEKVIAEGYVTLAETMGSYRNAMTMKREKINDKAIFVGKKKYILNVLNSEGVHYAQPKISVTGIESVRSSTPEVCRSKMVEAFRVFLDQDESASQDFIEGFRSQFYSLSVAEVAKISGTDDIEKFMDAKGNYTKGCPIHVRGAILYNQFLKQKGLDNKYESIRSGDKIKFVYLKMPNPIRENIISFPGHLPKELGLEEYVDYTTQFEKVFLNPLDIVLKSMGWSATKVNSLESFFS